MIRSFGAKLCRRLSAETGRTRSPQFFCPATERASGVWNPPGECGFLFRGVSGVAVCVARSTGFGHEDGPNTTRDNWRTVKLISTRISTCMRMLSVSC